MPLPVVCLLRHDVFEVLVQGASADNVPYRVGADELKRSPDDVGSRCLTSSLWYVSYDPFRELILFVGRNAQIPLC